MTTVTARIHALNHLIGDRWPGGVEIRLCAELARTLPRSLTHLVAVTADGFPTSVPGAPDRGNGGRSAAELTSVESAAHARRRSAEAYAALCARIGDAAASVALMDRHGVRDALRAAQGIVDAWQPPASETARSLRCSAPSDVHLEPWYRPDCDNVSAPGRQGLCDACAMRRRRWRATNVVSDVARVDSAS